MAHEEHKEQEEQPAPDAPYATFGWNITNFLKDTNRLLKTLVIELNDKAVELQRPVRFTNSQVSNWKQGKHLPETVSHLLVLSSMFENRSLDWLLGLNREDRPITDIISNKGTYVDTRTDTILNTKRLLWIQLRTAYFLEESVDHLKEIMQRGVQIRFLVCNPDENSPAMQVIALRRYRLHSNAENSALKIRQALTALRRDFRATGIKDELFDIRVTDYVPSIALYLSDPYQETGRLFGCTAFYRIDPYCSPVVVATPQHARIFKAYRKQFALLWRASKPYVEEIEE